MLREPRVRMKRPTSSGKFAAARGAQLQRPQLVLVGKLLQLEHQRQTQSRLQIGQLDGQLARRRIGRQQQAPPRITQPVEQMEQCLFPDGVASHGIQIVQADQLALLQVVQQCRAILGNLGQRQIDGQLAALLDPQAGCLQQVAATDAPLPPEIDQLVGPPRGRRTQALT